MGTPFFAFGADDGYFLQTGKESDFRELPPTLQRLFDSGVVEEIYHIALGPVKESWVCCYKDTTSTPRIAYGNSTPKPLKSFLTTHHPPSPHLKTTLGPHPSFFASSPTGIRWSRLPESLEEKLQSWLSPAGWKAGPPRHVALGSGGAWFACTEYGKLDWDFGEEGEDKWEIWKETMEEWDEEGVFERKDVSYLSLDPARPGQFIAILDSGVWTGSIEDSNADALEAFATSYFSKPKTRSKSKSKSTPQPSTNSSNPNPLQEDAPPDPKSSSSSHRNNATSNGPTAIPQTDIPEAKHQALYEAWATRTATKFASALAARGGGTAPKKLEIRHNPKPSSSNPFTTSSPLQSPPPSPNTPTPTLLTTFPYIPPALTTCPLPLCQPIKSNPAGLRACKHDVERLFRASGLYSYEWLKIERLRWHPDRFGRLCDERFREEGRRLAEEMWKVVDGLMQVERERMEQGRGKG